MKGTVLQFPNIHKRAYSEVDVEHYIDLVSKHAVFFARQTMMLEAMDNRIFSGVHNFRGNLEEKSYKKLLAFYNAPSMETWREIRSMCIFHHVTAMDTWAEFDKDFNSTPDDDESHFPSRNTFMYCMTLMKAKILQSNAKYLAQYKSELEKIVENNPGIKEAIDRRLQN